MGIADRDYAQPSGHQNGGFGGGPFGPGSIPPPRSWSVNTWLIVLNVAIFFIGAFFAGSGALSVDLRSGDSAGEGFDLSGRNLGLVEEIEGQSLRPDKGDAIVGYDLPIIDRDTGEIVGQRSFRRYFDPFRAFGHFSTGKGFFELEIWRLIAFQFLHANVWHLLFNMVGLFFFGVVVERYLGRRRLYAAFYLACGIAGAVLYLLLNLLGFVGVPLPGAFGVELYTPLIGASAGVFGVLMASAFIAPNSTLLVFGIIPMKLRTGAYLFVGLAFFNLLIGGTNAGGDAAHLGGAIAGYFFIRRPELLLNFFDDILGPDKSGKRGKRARVVDAQQPKEKKKTKRGPKPPSARDQQRMDELLAKVGTQGMHSLTDEERAFMDDMSKRMP
ncbi:MAG: rhomboid family intramembrane serine protease [Planctomycetota bacterium]